MATTKEGAKTMKPRTQTLIYLGLLFLLVGTTVVVILGGSKDKIVTDQVLIEPRPIDLHNSGVVTVHVKLSIKKGQELTPINDQIDPDTVVLEGGLTPFNTWYTVPGPHTQPEFVAQFYEGPVANYIISKINHMGITRPHSWNPFKVPLTISGLLYEEYGGTPWEGTGEAKVYFVPSESPPPPPPPPP